MGSAVEEQTRQLYRKLFEALDLDRKGYLEGEDLKDMIQRATRMSTLKVDGDHVLERAAQQEGRCTWQEFASWSKGNSVVEPEVERRAKEEGHIMPGRFTNHENFHDYGVKEQHPCYLTTAHDFGRKRPQIVDMPVRWHGAAGQFTKDFEMRVPGGQSVSINNFRNRSLRTMDNRSRVHKELDTPY